MKHHLLAGLLAASTLLACGTAHAQRAWLLPSTTLVEYREPWVTVDAAISEHLFNADRAPLKLDTLEITGPGGQRVAPANVSTGKLRSTFDIPLEAPGTYRAAVLLRNVMVSYKVEGNPQRWRGAEADMAKAVPANAQEVQVSRQLQRVETFVSNGSTTRGAFSTSGEGLELVPVTHPNDLRSGETATWKLLLDGQPAANLPFSVVPGGVRYRGLLGELRLSTDARGEVSFTLPAAGMVQLIASWPAAMPGGPGAGMPSRRLSYAATLEVLPP